VKAQLVRELSFHLFLLKQRPPAHPDPLEHDVGSPVDSQLERTIFALLSAVNRKEKERGFV